MIQDLIDEIINYISESGREGDAAKAKDAYFKEAGGLLGDEDSYDMRIRSFLEWYIFDRSVGGKTFVEEFAEKIADVDRRATIKELGESIRSIFEISKIVNSVLHLKDLSSNRKYIAKSAENTKIFKKGNIMEARLFLHDGGYLLSGSYIFHPEKARNIIAACLKNACSRNDLNTAINSLAVRNLKLEKYRNYNVDAVYRQGT